MASFVVIRSVCAYFVSNKTVRCVMVLPSMFLYSTIFSFRGISGRMEKLSLSLQE